MNKDEILEEINKTKEHLANMEKMLEECECKRWKPEAGGEYYFVTSALEAWNVSVQEIGKERLKKYLRGE